MVADPRTAVRLGALEDWDLSDVRSGLDQIDSARVDGVDRLRLYLYIYIYISQKDRSVHKATEQQGKKVVLGRTKGSVTSRKDARKEA